MLIQKAEGGLKKVSDGNMQIVENKHILAYGELMLFFFIIFFSEYRLLLLCSALLITSEDYKSSCDYSCYLVGSLHFRILEIVEIG